MKTAFVVAGHAPPSIVEQVRYAAERLTRDGRVLVAFTHEFRCDLSRPGHRSDATVLGVAATGFPLWVARRAGALGWRRRQDAVVVVWFDEVHPFLAALASVMARARGERIVVHDLGDERSRRSRRRRAFRRLIDLLAEAQVGSVHEARAGRAVALAMCRKDPDLAALVIGAAHAMASDTAVGWRFVIQSDDPEVLRLVAAAPRGRMITLERSATADDVLMMSDVVITRYGRDESAARHAAHNGGVAILVGHPVAGRLLRRLDGCLLARDDVSSLLVALEAAHDPADSRARSAPEVRTDGDRVVRAVRTLHPVAT